MSHCPEGTRIPGAGLDAPPRPGMPIHFTEQHGEAEGHPAPGEGLPLPKAPTALALLLSWGTKGPDGRQASTQLALGAGPHGPTQLRLPLLLRGFLPQHR